MPAMEEFLRLCHQIKWWEKRDPKADPATEEFPRLCYQITRREKRDPKAEPALLSYLYSTILSHSSDRSLSFNLGNKLCSFTFLYDLFLNAFSSDSNLRSAAISALSLDPDCVSCFRRLLNNEGFLPASPASLPKVYYRRWTRKRDPNCDPSNRIIDIITRASAVVIIVAYDVQGGSSGPMKVAKGLTKKKTLKGAKGGRGRKRSISGVRDGKAIRDINRDPAPHIKRDCHSLHIETNRRSEVGVGVSQASSVERRGESPDELEWESGSESTCGGRDQERGESVESECRDAEEGEGSRSWANQDRDGEGEGISSGESQGQDRGEGSASGENQGGDDEDERERQRRAGGDIEQGIQENNQEEIKLLAGITEAFLTIICSTLIAAIDLHSSGAISSTTLSLVMVTNVFGFLFCMISMLHRHRKPRTARIFGTIGAGAAGFGLLLPVSEYFTEYFSSYYGWMILVLGTLAILVICGLAFFP